MHFTAVTDKNYYKIAAKPFQTNLMFDLEDIN